jgi:hypothetical protein
VAFLAGSPLEMVIHRCCVLETLFAFFLMPRSIEEDVSLGQSYTFANRLEEVSEWNHLQDTRQISKFYINCFFLLFKHSKSVNLVKMGHVWIAVKSIQNQFD